MEEDVTVYAVDRTFDIVSEGSDASRSEKILLEAEKREQKLQFNFRIKWREASKYFSPRY